jgi:hypothetical protein
MAKEDLPEPLPPSGAKTFVDKIVKDPQQPPNALVLQGYLGSSSEPDHTRLYFDLPLSTFVEIPDAAILHVENTATAEMPLGVSYVWIDSDATLVHGRPGPERVRARFLEGPIAQAGAVAPQLQPIPPPTVGPACNTTFLAALCPPSLQAALCPSAACTHIMACQTAHQPCLTHQPTPCAPCPTQQVTPCAPCPTQQVTPCAPCPTHQISACGPCHTPHHPVCPSIACTHLPFQCGGTIVHPCPPLPAFPDAQQAPRQAQPLLQHTVACPFPGTPVCPTHVVQLCQHQTPFCPTHVQLCPPHTPFCPTHLVQLCPPHTPFCPVNTGFCPVNTLACPVNTLACPVNTAACPVNSLACPFPTSGCPFGGGGGGF